MEHINKEGLDGSIIKIDDKLVTDHLNELDNVKNFSHFEVGVVPDLCQIGTINV